MDKKKILCLLSLISMTLGGCTITPSGTSSSSSKKQTSSSSIVETSSETSESSSEESKITSVTISNKDALQATWFVGDKDRRIDISLVANGVGLDKALSEGLITISSDNESAVKVTGKNIKAVGVGTATITVRATNSIKDTVTVTVSEKSYEAPTITLTTEDGKVYDTLSGTSVNLPQMTCVDNHGTDLSRYVTITSDLDPYASITPDLFLSFVEGRHTLTYSVTHPNDSTKTSSETFVVNVYRNLLREAGDWSVENELAPNEEQKVLTTNTGFGTVKLNYDASSYYYIETEIELPTNHHGGHHVGISNYNVNNPDQFLVFDLDLGDFNWKIKNFKTLGEGSWNLEKEVDNWRLGEYYQKPTYYENGKTVKLAVARDGRNFYMFVNDLYLGMTTDNEYSNNDSYPGLFTHQGHQGTKFTKINYISGQEDVKNKINILTNNGSDMITGYIAGGYDWAFDSRNTDNRNFTVNPYSEERGVNFDFTNENTHHNSGMVSLYQYLDGNFKFEFDYKPTSENTLAEKDQKMWIEARPMDYSGEIFWLGTKFRENDAEQMIHGRLTDEVSEIWNTSTITDPRAGMHYEVIRTVGETNTTFTLRITSLADSTQVVERTLTYSGKAWNDKLILIWHNTSLAGQYSNIKLETM